MKKQKHYIKNELLCKIVMFFIFISISLLNVHSQSQIYFSNMVSPVVAPATSAMATGGFQTATLSGWTGYDSGTYPGYFLTTGSAGQITLTWATPLALALCGDGSNGSIVVMWGSTSNRPLNATLNGGTLTKIDEITTSGERSVVRTATYAIPSSTATLSNLKLNSSGGGAVYIFSAQVNSCAAGPILMVTPATRSGFTYVTGAGPSANQTIAVSGFNLTAGAAITITAPANYEVSTAAGGPYGATATIANAAGGTLAATNIYVRLKSGLAVGLYNGVNVTVSGGGAAGSQTVAVSGSVTSGVLTPLPAPVPGAGTGATSSTFTAHWTTVANATGGYEVHVYQGAVLVKTVVVAGQATNLVVVSGLTASTTYTYKMVAVGDGLTYSNSPESAASPSIATSAPPAGGTCEIRLYSTDFHDWTAKAATSNDGNPISVSTGGGAGFIVTEDSEINPVLGRETIVDADERIITFPPFNFVNGGSVYIEGNNTTGDAMAGIAGATGVFNATTGAAVVFGDIRNMAYNVRFDLGAGVNGPTALTYRIRGYITKIIVCTNPSGLPQVATTDYMPAPAAGLSLSGTVGGAVVPGSANVKAWNITCPITMSIVGADAALFTLPVTTLTQAEALAGTPVAINFTPSVVAGVSNAQLKLTSACGEITNPYYMNISGKSSTGAAPQITTPIQTWNFPTSLIAPITQNIPISGVNLTGPVTMTLIGADAAQFSLASNTVTLAQALAGTPIQVTYLGGISSPLTQNATLRLSSPGAPNVDIPLVGLTYNLPPTMYSLTKNVIPAGTGFITQDLGGTLFAVGTTVSVTVVPQTGYKFKRWTDNGSTALVRSILMISNMNITAEFEIGTGPSVSPFNAYTPLVVGNTSFTARWGAAAASTSYVVKVYNSAGTLIYTSPAQGAAVRSLNITGLTAGTQYTYTVTASTGDVSNIVGPVLTTGGSFPACGAVGSFINSNKRYI